MNTTVEKILNLISQHGISAHKLEVDANIAISSIQAWKNGKSKPSLEAVSKIADYFNVSVDYLLGKTATNIYPVESITVFAELGTIRAGFEGTIDEVPTGREIEIPTSFLRGRPASDYFTLKVSGDSMYPLFMEGDTILCLRTNSVDCGDYAVILYNGDEATVKKVNFVPGESWLELVPINPMYQPKKLKDSELLQCRVLGKVISAIRQF